MVFTTPQKWHGISLPPDTGPAIPKQPFDLIKSLAQIVSIVSRSPFGVNHDRVEPAMRPAISAVLRLRPIFCGAAEFRNVPTGEVISLRGEASNGPDCEGKDRRCAWSEQQCADPQCNRHG
jgi:hypothetical protein